jgi:ubiquitin carboxyl-terminal hydrolase L3
MSDNNKNNKNKWFPLESNPPLINKYIGNLGFDTSLYEFTDVFSTEDWAIDMIPQPVMAVIMLYPLSAKQEACRLVEDDIADAKTVLEQNVWFIQQRIGNACGTIGLLHCLLNLPAPLNTFLPNSWLAKFQQDCPVSMSPLEKSQRLEQDDQVAQFHDDATSSEDNQTSRGNLDDNVDTHFIALICGRNDNILYELDGRKQGPVLHGPTSPTTFLKDACAVVQKFMQRDPDEVRFTILALAPKAE